MCLFSLLKTQESNLKNVKASQNPVLHLFKAFFFSSKLIHDLGSM
jgi:hypothetical protein